MMGEDDTPEFAFGFPIIEPRSPARRRQGFANLVTQCAMRFAERRPAEDAPQRPDVTGVGFCEPQLCLEAVIDLPGVVQADEEAETGDVDLG